MEGADLFKLLVSSVTEYAIFALDETGVVRTWNAGAERIKGYTAGRAQLARRISDASEAAAPDKS